MLWLKSATQKVSPNLTTLQQVGIKTLKDYVSRLNERFMQIQPDLPRLKRQLQPFLFNPEQIKLLDYFDQLVNQVVF